MLNSIKSFTLSLAILAIFQNFQIQHALAQKPQASQQKGAPQKSEPAGLRVHCNAKEASVLANGFYVGRAKTIIYLPPGKPTITVTAPGFRPEQRQIQLKSGKILELRVELKLIPGSSGVEENDYGSVSGLSTPKKTTVDFSGDTPSPEAPQVSGPQAQAPFEKGSSKPTLPGRSQPLSPWLKILPFGVPQFLEDKTTIGMLAAGVQTIGLGIAGYYIWTDQRFKATAESELQKRVSPSDKESYRKKADSYREYLFTNQLVGWGIFATAYGLSVYEAFREPPRKKNVPRVSFTLMPKDGNIFLGSQWAVHF